MTRIMFRAAAAGVARFTLYLPGCYSIMKSRSMNWAVSALLLLTAGAVAVSNAQDPLPSWNQGAAKQSIIEFVRVTTTLGGPKFVAPEQRIATFDQDGTLWVEHPMYTQVVYCLERVRNVVEERPELRGVEPFKTVLSGEHAAIAKLSMNELQLI